MIITFSISLLGPKEKKKVLRLLFENDGLRK